MFERAVFVRDDSPGASHNSQRNKIQMTFLEAAIEVLRDAPEPLHYSAIAKQAVARKLLSHVGRDPEAAMQKCLTSAVRAGDEALLARSKPAHYQIREGADLPARSTPPAAEIDEAPAPPKRTKRARRGKSRDEEAASPSAESKKEAPEAVGTEANAAAVEFEAPEGSGLEGVTDVALVMANAMSRLAEARPELKQEFEASQARAQGEGPTVVHKVKGRIRNDRQPRGGENEERGNSKRKRRRRRKSRKAEWGATDAEPRQVGEAEGDLLGKAAAALEAAGARSVHIRQLAESLAKEGLLGGDISEIERSVTAEILSDVHRHGANSRFVACGEARYEARGVRLPAAAWTAERALRSAQAEVAKQTDLQLRAWLTGLGPRGLETLVRMYLTREGYRVRSTMVPARGICRMLVEDGEGDEERYLVVVAPKKAAVEMRVLESEAERASCVGVLAFVMGDADDEVSLDSRVISVGEFCAWMIRNGVGVQQLTLEAPVLEARVIESIRGLDT